jgi:tetratricopeptide (TPR) repeat protein
MTTPKSKRLTTKKQLEELIENAKDAEACRDMDAVREILRPVWSDIQESPDIIRFDDPVKAELLRLCGFFLAFHGFSKGKKDCQERGRDLLTNAIEIFAEIGCPHKLTEAKISLALCYWYEGAADESEAILVDAESQYDGNRNHDVYLQIAYYRMISLSVKKDYQAVSQIIEDLKPFIEGCTNTRIQALFYTEAGVDCRRRKRYEEAKEYYVKALSFAHKLNSKGLVAANWNNLAYLYKETAHFEKAHKYIDEAIKINKDRNQTGFLAHKYDTKALIYFDVRDYENALVYFNKAIDLFRKGEDHLGLVEALFSKSTVLLRLGQIENGLRLFCELMGTAQVRLGNAAAERFIEEFSKLVYPKRRVSYREEVRLFQKDLIRNALLDSGNVTSKAKDMLSISQKGMSEILNKQFPELCEEVGIERRPSERKIRPVIVNDIQMAGIDGSSLLTFYMSKDKLPQLEFHDDVVVAVQKGIDQKLEAGKYYLVQCQVRNVLDCGRLCKLESLGLYYFENENNPSPFTAKDVKIVGQIVGYCCADEAKDKVTRFRPIS